MATATHTNNDDKTARQLLLALRLLDAERQRVLHEKKSAEKKWRDELSEATKTLNTKIQETNPVEDQHCRNRLNEIRALFRARQDTKDEKAEELGEIKDRLQEIEAALVECIRSEPSDQQTLDLTEAGPGMALTSEAAKVVAGSMTAALELGAEMTPDMEGLRDRLRELGAKALHVVRGPDEDEDEAEEEDEEEDEGEEGEEGE